MLSAPISAAASGDNTVVPAVAGRAIRVLAYTFVAAGAVNATWKDGTGGTAESGAMPLAAQTVVSATCQAMSKYELPLGLFEITAGNALVLNLSAAVLVAGHVSYILVP